MKTHTYMDNLRRVDDFVNKIIEEIDLTDYESKQYSKLSQTIQTTLTQLQSNLENLSEEDLLKINISTFKKQFEEAGIGHLFGESDFQQIDHLLADLKTQRFVDIGSRLEALAANFEAVGPQPDVDMLIAGLEKHIPPQYFIQIAPKLKNVNPNILRQTIREVAQKLKEKPENLDLDAVVQVFEQNLGALFGEKRQQQEEQRMQEYRGLARQSILKSLQAKGFPPPNKE